MIRINPDRAAGFWYLLLVLLGPVRLIYIQSTLIVRDDAELTVHNLLLHETLFRLGMVADLCAAMVLIMMVTAFYRLFQSVDRRLAMLVVILGGVMPAVVNLFQVTLDATALTIAKGAPYLAVFTIQQQNALARIFLRMHDHQSTAAEILWGAWLLPLALLIYRSRFLPRFLAWWLALNGVAYLVLSVTGLLARQGNLFLYFQPALLGEVVLMLWLVIKGAGPSSPEPIK